MTQLVWLITGCSSGFGEEFVRQILSRGDRVIATARKAERLKPLEDAGAAGLRLDVTDKEESIRETVGNAISIYGRIDVLVNNAAYIETGAWEDLGHEKFLSQFDTNVFGTIKVTRAVMPHFRERRSGSMVFLSSRSGWFGDPFCGAYSGSKFALEGLVESLRSETERFGIKTLLIEPGRFRTKFLSAGNLKTVQSEISDYRDASSAFIDMLAGEDQAQPGDTSKAVGIILDLVREEGIASGRAVPFRLPLGTDCYETMKGKCEETLKMLDEWKGVITSTDY